jgi:CHAT domain-containing protein/tetratricopeptide (TPR) repeat protein
VTRCLLALTIIIFAACRSSVISLDAEFHQAQDLLSQERYELALPRAEEGLARAQRIGVEADLWRFRLLKADIQMGQRLAAKTLVLLDEFGEPPAGPEWNEVRAHLLLLRGRGSYTLNRLGEAEDFLARSAVAARQAGSDSLAADVTLRQGALFVRQSRFEAARQAFQTVIESAQRLHDRYQEANALGNMGYDLLTESRHDEAIVWFEKAINIFTSLGAGDSVARTHGNLGNCYFRLGDYDNARTHYQSADEWFAKTGSRDSQQIWIGNAANVSYQLADYSAAETAYKRALDVARQIPSPVWIARWLTNLAATSLELGNWDAAETYNQEALAKMRLLHDTSWEPTALVNAARIAEGRGDHKRARELFRSALTKRAEDPGVPLDSHAGLARTYLREGRLQEAEVEFRNTLQMVEQRGAKLVKDEHKLSYLSSLIQFYREYVDFLVSNGHIEKALEVAESSRSRVLVEKTGGRAAVERHVARDYQRVARLTQSTLLEYWLSPGRSYLWVITPKMVRLSLLPSASTIHPLIESYRAVIAGGRNPLDVAADTGQQLSGILLAPIANDASGGHRFILVEDGDLHSLPMESLPGRADSRKFWIEEATVAITPSLNYLATQARLRTERSRELLVIGDSSSSSPQYPRLEFASEEIDSIASSMRAPQSAILRGDNATPNSYNTARPGRFGFIHLAAHATVNPQSPLDSAVILAGPAEKNRLLARDVMSVPLSAELVTISACRSAGGKSYAGEGMVGFAWAFLSAGARNVIAGLWDVSDRSTAQLMSQLYRGIASGEDAMQALHSAKLSLLHSGGAYGKPFYWAPFQLYVGPPLAAPRGKI